MSAMATLILALLLLALLLFAAAALGVAHKRVQLVPAAFFLVLLAHLLRLWWPP